MTTMSNIKTTYSDLIALIKDSNVVDKIFLTTVFFIIPAFYAVMIAVCAVVLNMVAVTFFTSLAHGSDPADMFSYYGMSAISLLLTLTSITLALTAILYFAKSEVTSRRAMQSLRA